VVTEFRGVERALDPEGPRQRSAADRQVETDHGGVQVRTPAGQRTAPIGNTTVLDQHHTQQAVSGGALPASDACSLRAG
jgi:hypothetical protein